MTGEDPIVRSISFWQMNDKSCMTLSLNDLKELCGLLDMGYASLLLENMISGLPER